VACLCTDGVYGRWLALIDLYVAGAKMAAMWDDRLFVCFYMGLRATSIVKYVLVPVSSMIMGGDFTFMDYIVWNEIPTVAGNLAGVYY